MHCFTLPSVLQKQSTRLCCTRKGNADGSIHFAKLPMPQYPSVLHPEEMQWLWEGSQGPELQGTALRAVSWKAMSSRGRAQRRASSPAAVKVPFHLLYRKTPLPFKFPFLQGWQVNHSSLAITGELHFIWPVGDCNACTIHFPNMGCVCFPGLFLSDSTVDVSTSETTKALTAQAWTCYISTYWCMEEVLVLFLSCL